MTKQIIFISSVQKEFAVERRALKDFIQSDALLRRYFEVFLFEDLPASDRHADATYLNGVDQCEVYVGLFGNNYGAADSKGVSPTEREFNRATATSKERLIFIWGNDDKARHPKMSALIRKADNQLIRRRVVGLPDLTAGLYASLVDRLERTGDLRHLPFDAAACPRATLRDLSKEKLTDFLERAQRNRDYALAPNTKIEKALTHLNLLDGNHPSHAAVLLFGKQPQKFLISSEVKCLHFHGTQVLKPIPSYQIYKGTLFELVNQACDFVMSKINRTVGTRAQGPQAPVDYELPRDAVMEAIVDAVVHRDYASKASVQVMLFSDRLEIWNPGELPPPLTIERLRAPHASLPRNPLIADPFFLARYIEKAGTGILDMIALCKKAGLPTPKFRQEDGLFVQTLYRPKGPKPVKAQEAQAKAQEAQAEPTGLEKKLLAASLKEPKTGQELLAAVGYTERSGNFKRSMEKLLAQSLLVMTMPDKPRSSNQKYRLTPKGKALLVAHRKIKAKRK